MTGKDGKEHAHAVLSDAKVTCNGKAYKVADLKAGMKIRVSTQPTDKGSVIEIEAIYKNAVFS